MTETIAEPVVKFPGTTVPTPSPLLDQYKAYVADLGNIGTRYTAAQTFYFTIVSALIGVLAFKDASQNLDQYVSVKLVLVLLFIAAICFIWRKTLLHYDQMFRAKFDIIRQLENLGLYTVFEAEGLRLKQLRGQGGGLISNEVKIPWVLMWIALALAIASILYLFNHMKSA